MGFFLVLPFVSWEPRKIQVLEKSLFNEYINTRYKHVVSHSMFFFGLFFTLLFLFTDSRLISTAASNRNQYNLYTLEKILALIFSDVEQCDGVETCSFVWKCVCSIQTFLNVLNCTKITLCRCHICCLHTQQRSSFYPCYYRLSNTDNKTQMEKSPFWTFLVLCKILST